MKTMRCDLDSLENLSKEEISSRISKLNAKIKGNNRSYNMFHKRAMLYYAIGNFQMSMKDFTRTLKLDPWNKRNIGWYFHRGICRKKLGSFDDAIEDFKKVKILAEGSNNNKKFLDDAEKEIKICEEIKDGNILERAEKMFEKVEEMRKSNYEEIIEYKMENGEEEKKEEFNSSEILLLDEENKSFSENEENETFEEEKKEEIILTIEKDMEEEEEEEEDNLDEQFLQGNDQVFKFLESSRIQESEIKKQHQQDLSPKKPESPKKEEIHKNHYEINQIGEGKYSEVFKANFGKVIALKKIRLDSKQDKTALSSRIQELKVLPTEYIIKIHSHYFIDENNELYIEMEYMNGKSLRDCYNSMSSSEKLSIVKKMVTAVKCLHDKNIIHGNIKCSNFLLSNDRNVLKISDFGLFKEENNRGSLRWMAPELIRKESKYSKESDIYSLGMAIYELFKEEIPFFKKTDNYIIKFLQNDTNNENKNKMIDSLVDEKIKNLIKLCTLHDRKKRKTASNVDLILKYF